MRAILRELFLTVLRWSCWSHQAHQEPTVGQREVCIQFPYIPKASAKQVKLALIKLHVVTVTDCNWLLPQSDLSRWQSCRLRFPLELTQEQLQLAIPHSWDNPALLTARAHIKISGQIITKMDRSANRMLKANQSPWKAEIRRNWWYNFIKETFTMLPPILWLSSSRPRSFTQASALCSCTSWSTYFN